ncbi:MAG: hypothetical protein A3I11_07640 [Elusimicrobia bacterium RIFCSPLOWO2_02_FULL_39_32]|nr:MAG: hypothetical protein A2034_01275 [Elusimicrobia bacterium GWA2_38_7]OGR79746.1 MAG: hypothetical protein A3B80_01060 [Elusimicrobia bacterium RIFCSPHIGHO2_02_FULL_39_36]OGR92057.1 MAG: hypothetical protein A3I11_07640 [Elusimicrobia bacterium RIFCSPLOWO2_02_FULL_39_32]
MHPAPIILTHPKVNHNIFLDTNSKSCYIFYMTLKSIEKAVKSLNLKEQRKLLTDLPLLIHISQEDIARLKVSEKSFQFWDNPEDSIYDTL